MQENADKAEALLKAMAVTFTTIWRNFFSGKWRAGGDIWKRSRADVRA